MREPFVRFLWECLAALVAAGVLAAVGIPLVNLMVDPAPRWLLQTVVWGGFAISLLVATLRPGGSLRRR